MRLRYIWIVIILMWIPSMVSAEFYRYTDENGVIHFTDSLSEVPADQRKKMVQYADPAEETSFETSDMDAETADKEAMLPGNTDNITKTDIVIPKGSQADGLLRTKAELDQEYSELVKKGETLNSMADMPFAKEDFEAYREKINRFNERKADYEKRVNELQQKVDAYHQQQTMEAETFTKTESQKATTAESLVKAKAELDKAYSDLMKEREAIVSKGSDPDVFSTTEKFEAHKEKVALFNERKADYDKRAKDYQEKAEAFNKTQTK